jgi:hypothetical protein
MTGRLSRNCHSSMSSPNGTAGIEPNTVSPTGDQITIGIVKTSATRKRLRMSRTIASNDMPA